jgi:hypothetical protein
MRTISGMTIKKLHGTIVKAIEKLDVEILPKARDHSLIQPKDEPFIAQRIAELQRLKEQSAEAPMFSIRFLGDAQNGKSTLINVLLGKKILPEGHTGACSAAIVRCRHKEQDKFTVEFRYCTAEAFDRDVEDKLQDAQAFLDDHHGEPEATRREGVCAFLGRFLRLLDIDPVVVPSPEQIIELVRSNVSNFEERSLLGSTETLEATQDNEDRIHENLSARGKRAFIIDECIIEGPFPEWHPAMELVDMPGTNAFNPYDDQVNARLKQKVGGLAIVTKDNQLSRSVMDWFKESSILSDVAGASERNQVRVFVLKTFVDTMNLPQTEDGRSDWEKTQAYCADIEHYLRGQILNLIGQRFSEQNEIDVLRQFVSRIPVCFLSPRVYRSLANDALRNAVLNNPMQHLAMAAAFERFAKSAENTGVPGLRQALHGHTEEFITKHFRRKLELELQEELGRVAQFFRVKRMGLEQGLARESAFVLEVEQYIQANLPPRTKSYRSHLDEKITALKEHFHDEVGALLETVEESFAERVRRKLEDWVNLHWASLRCAGRKSGQHTTGKGYEIDFNGDLADFCVRSLNSRWIKYREKLRKMVFDELQVHFLPQIESVISQAKGTEEKRIALVDGSYGAVVERARQEIELQIEKYDNETEGYDALRPKLMESIRTFLLPTYENIAGEAGRGSSTRMRRHLNKGILSSIHKVGGMVKNVVRKNWQGLTDSIEKRVDEFFEHIDQGMIEQSEHLRNIAEMPSDEQGSAVSALDELEREVSALFPLPTQQEEAVA